LAGVHLHVVGPEWDVSVGYLTREASRLGVLDRVTFHGRLHQNELEQLALECGVFVSASLYEGFGMSMIEAMSAGLVPVVQPNPSFEELIGSSPVGVTVDFADPPAAARAIRAELAQLTLDRRRAAVAFANRFSWRTHAERTVSYYHQALAHADRRWHAPFWRPRSA
jgi:alpha-1,3-mannosyltransferase